MIGLLLLILSCSVIGNAIYKIVNHIAPETAIWGIFVSSISLGVMFILYWFKLRSYEVLDSPTIDADAKCTWGCMREGITLLIGSGIQVIAIR